MGSVLFKTILGIIAGVVGWVLVEPFKPDFTDGDKWTTFETMMMLAWGALIGGAIGFSSGMLRGSRTHILRELGLGALFGCIGIAMGRGLATPFAAIINMPGGFIGRTLALAAIGAGLGAGIGFSTFVPRRGLQGLIGGVIGGALAGFLFDPLAHMLQGVTLVAQGVAKEATGETGGPSRGLTGAMMGGFIAMMIGIIEALSKSAWIRLELGRNEGKEWVIDKGTMVIGRSERADIPLFGGNDVAPQHAVIHKQGSQYVLVDQGSPMGTGVNGQRTQQTVLNPNDVIQIGGMNLRFITKNVKAPKRDPEAMRNMSYPINHPGVAQQPMGHPMPGQMPGQMPGPMGTPMSAPMDPTMMAPQYHNPQMNATVMNPTIMNQPPMNQTVMNQTVMNPTAMNMPGAGFMLVAMDGPLAGQRFPLGMPIEMGRESSQIPMAYDTSASRRHARIEPTGQQISISDLGSTNGTFLNGQRITNGSAKNGDILKVGATNFRIES